MATLAERLRDNANQWEEESANATTEFDRTSYDARARTDREAARHIESLERALRRIVEEPFTSDTTVVMVKESAWHDARAALGTPANTAFSPSPTEEGSK